MMMGQHAHYISQTNKQKLKSDKMMDYLIPQTKHAICLHIMDGELMADQTNLFHKPNEKEARR